MSVTEGQCLCGAVQITLPAPLATSDACHCSMCRKLTSGGPLFALHCAGGAKPAVSGEEHVTVYRSSDWAERAFCSICGTPLWYRFIEDDFHSISAGLFDGNALTLEKQIFIEEKPALYDLANDTPKLTGEELVAEYMAKREGTQ
ncbi:MAG: GFA family protein [Pseudomonadota bacterium]